jgi:hypothetical protein
MRGGVSYRDILFSSVRGLMLLQVLCFSAGVWGSTVCAAVQDL